MTTQGSGILLNPANNLDESFDLEQNLILLQPQYRLGIARMAELVDALVSNTCAFTGMPVRLRLRVQQKNHSLYY